ncbi:uncharacterized protein Z518_02000 [Rhinocladiella mackenziei CBS 650.93]|uniref:BTB domain-containing protein n=1 Tax=Rhinocladiella mackenziei CBS 650.93 TaxID=1442369 RepID=A0A0D2FYF4_9EURO|nr:uncharacterized protein Z518_02000 [Rhinocladiella mackenziei CBS 650.93]KIX07347.1 hypothetical protein Z518_02000 [Rhinocladiella mackenziei CBS 650.93]
MADKKSTGMDVNSLVLAPEGDVVLVVGAKQLRIRADSLFLKRHSPVFTALFGPNFCEGQDLNTSSPKEIPLPDDDPDAMTAICATMYHAFDQIPRSPATGFVLSIVRHADKYDCYDVLTLPSQAYGWLKSDNLTLGKDLVNTLAISYLVRDQEAFTNASKALVSKYDGSFADLADNVICDVLPWKTFCRLEELRTRIQTLAASIVVSALPKPNYSGYGYTKYHSPECSKLAEGLQEKLRKDLSMEAQQEREQNDRKYSYRKFPRPPATWQPEIGPLLEKLQELAKACKGCKKSVEASQLHTFGLRLAGNDLRQVAMLPEWYWGLKLTH